MRAEFSPTFYRVAGLASALSVITTLMLIFLPSFFAPLPDGIPGRMLRVTDPAYQLRAWAYQIHPFLAFTAVLGVGIACRRVSPALALGGTLAFALWALTEAAQQSLARPARTPSDRHLASASGAEL